jgi:hypothetical protein
MEATTTDTPQASHLDGSHKISAPAPSRLTKRTFSHPLRLLFDLRRSHARSVSLPTCPQCAYMVNRSRRSGWKDSLARVLGRYPYRCRACNYRFYLSRPTT